MDARRGQSRADGNATERRRTFRCAGRLRWARSWSRQQSRDRTTRPDGACRDRCHSRSLPRAWPIRSARLRSFTRAANHVRCVSPPFTGRGSIKVFYASTRHDAAEAGFDDQFIYEQLPLEIAARSLPMNQLMREHALELFREWAAKPDKIPY